MYQIYDIYNYSRVPLLLDVTATWTDKAMRSVKVNTSNVKLLCMEALHCSRADFLTRRKKTAVLISLFRVAHAVRGSLS